MLSGHVRRKVSLYYNSMLRLLVSATKRLPTTVLKTMGYHRLTPPVSTCLFAMIHRGVAGASTLCFVGYDCRVLGDDHSGQGCQNSEGIDLPGDHTEYFLKRLTD